MMSNDKAASVAMQKVSKLPAALLGLNGLHLKPHDPIRSQANAVQVCLKLVIADCKTESCESLSAFQMLRYITPCGKALRPFVVLEAFAGEVVDGWSDMVASGPKCQWKLGLLLVNSSVSPSPQQTVRGQYVGVLLLNADMAAWESSKGTILLGVDQSFLRVGSYLHRTYFSVIVDGVSFQGQKVLKEIAVSSGTGSFYLRQVRPIDINMKSFVLRI
ncbi:hypothetical protein CDAR_530681 [Caerostris darwini]|uniref:Uncharacterized protein n=1 Tax=Caerostris darwini TaxID=1538125 RepID=A0AAV4N7K9_9ARAC|nr:hypothetical protein CDAR_530681 [Caerostris darwini]